MQSPYDQVFHYSGNLVAHITFDGQDYNENSFMDISGNNNPLFFNGEINFTSAPDRFGHNDRSYEFTVTHGPPAFYLQQQNTSLATKHFTATMWTSVSTADTMEMYFLWASPVNVYNDFTREKESRTLEVEIRMGRSLLEVELNFGSYNSRQRFHGHYKDGEGDWNFIALTADSFGNVLFYINGNKAAHFVLPPNSSIIPNEYIIVRLPYSGQFSLDDLLIYDYPMAPGQIKRLYEKERVTPYYEQG